LFLEGGEEDDDENVKQEKKRNLFPFLKDIIVVVEGTFRGTRNVCLFYFVFPENLLLCISLKKIKKR